MREAASGAIGNGASCVALNGDATCFIAAVASGYAVFSAEPLSLCSTQTCTFVRVVCPYVRSAVSMLLYGVLFRMDVICTGGVIRPGCRVSTMLKHAAISIPPVLHAHTSAGVCDGRVSSACMYATSNCVGLLVTSPAAHEDPCSTTAADNSAMLWDDASSSALCTVQASPSANRDAAHLCGIRLAKSQFVLVYSNAIRVYSVSRNPQLLYVIETQYNKLGLCCVNWPVIAYPGLSERDDGNAKGIVELRRLDDPISPQPLRIHAHNSPLVCMALCASGSKLATASRKGTLLRVFSCADGTLLHQLRRGKIPAPILAINLSKDGAFLCALSGHNTLHVFSLCSEQQEKHAKADTSQSSSETTSPSSAENSPAHSTNIVKRVIARRAASRREHIAIPKVFQPEKHSDRKMQAQCQIAACWFSPICQAVVERAYFGPDFGPVCEPSHRQLIS